MHKPAILLIYTGGTIGMVKDFETGALKAFNFNQLLERIPELQLLDCTIDTYSFEDPIDSSDMNPEHWITIAEVVEKNYYDFDGFVVLHGSDTMSYTASALSFMFQNLTKPVGIFYTEAEAALISKELGYTFVEDSGRGYRRVVVQSGLAGCGCH